MTSPSLCATPSARLRRRALLLAGLVGAAPLQAAAQAIPGRADHVADQLVAVDLQRAGRLRVPPPLLGARPTRPSAAPLTTAASPPAPPVAGGE